MRTGGFRGALPVALVIASLITLLLLSPSPVHAALTPHDPIYIDGNAGFIPANGVVAGSGTAGDPYIIENWDIDISKYGVPPPQMTPDGIVVRNTNAYFIIRDCYVHDGEGYSSFGIYFDNVMNGKIDNAASDNNNRGIFLSYSSNNDLEDCVTKNNNYGISIFFDSNKNDLENCTVFNNKLDGIGLSSSNNNNIMNCTILNNSRGIYLGYSDNNTLDNNTCENNYDGIYIYESGNNTLDNNTCGNNDWGIMLYDSDNNLIDNNLVENSGYLGIFLWNYSNNNLLSNNTVENSGWSCIRLDNSSYNTISNNIAENSRGYKGIMIWDSNHNTISNNTCSNNHYTNIDLWNSDNNIISNNIAEKSQMYHGINLWNSDNNTISNNTCSNNYYHGIELYENSDNNLVSNNFMEGNDWDGICLYLSENNMIDNNIAESNSVGIFLNTSDNNLISNNILESNTQQGIFIYYSGNNNLISNNLAVRNHTGIYIQNYSDNNRIFHNNLVNNTNQAHDSCSNDWDNGYPSGGNYWSDYTGEDNYQGENQDIPGSDGIGDTPYYIPAGSNQDRYPIMSPFLFRDVVVEISPVYQEGPAKATLTYIVTVKNLGTENDNYDLTLSDDAGWGPTLSDNLLEVPAGENGQTTLSVTVPENAPPCTEDTMTVIATSQVDNRIKDVSSCKAHAISPKAELSLVTLYEARLDLNLYLENGSKLVVKFYTYEDIFENENVFWSGTTPAHVKENENVPHSGGIGVKKVRLDLTYDNTEDIISTIASFTVTRDDLFGRIMGIKGLWPIADDNERNALFNEIMDIKGQWPFAP